MKRFLCLVVILSLFFLISLGNAETIGPDAKKLWHHISVESPYQSWGFWNDHQGLQQGDAPHAPQHKVFVNEPGRSSTSAPAQDGTIVVKENIGNDNELKALTVMYKVKDYNAKTGNWFWAKYSPEGKVAKSGKVKGCISCHSSEEENDFIFVHEFK